MNTNESPQSSATAVIPPILLNRQQVCQMTGLSAPTLYRLRAAGKFPASVSPIGHPRWRRVDVERWAERLKATRPAGRRKA